MPGKMEDLRLLMCIHRANLNAMWAQEPTTVKKKLEEAKQARHMASQLGIQTPFPHMGCYAAVLAGPGNYS